MFFLVKLIRKFVKIITSQSALWQVWLGACIGIFLGMLPWWSLTVGPNWLTWGLLLIALFINCHLGSVLFFTGIGALLGLVLEPLAISIGSGMDGFARGAADNAFLYSCMLSNTRALGLTILACAIAPIAGTIMAWATYQFEKRLRARLEHRRKLIKAGKTVSNPILLKVTCWFLGF